MSCVARFASPPPHLQPGRAELTRFPMTRKAIRSGAVARRLLTCAAVAGAMAFVISMATSRVNAISTGIVISQVYGGGGNSGATLKNDFIELYNRGTTAVNASGWSVQ